MRRGDVFARFTRRRHEHTPVERTAAGGKVGNSIDVRPSGTRRVNAGLSETSDEPDINLEQDRDNGRSGNGPEDRRRVKDGEVRRALWNKPEGIKRLSYVTYLESLSLLSSVLDADRPSVRNSLIILKS